MKKVLGIDLGGTSAKVGVVNQYGEIEHKTEIKNDKDNLLPNLVDKILEELDKWGYDYKTDIERIGFDAPGFIDHKDGIVKIAGNLNWFDFDLKSELEELFHGKPVYVLNDANAAALGEFWTGAASKYNSEIFYTLGTGVGGAIVLDGKLVTGEHGFAGEFGHGGHMQKVFDCNCGLTECLEPVSSAIGMAKVMRKLFNDDPKHPVRKLFEDNGVEIDKLEMRDISEVYDATKDPQLKALMLEIYRPLLTHMSLMIYALDVKAIILGGGGSKMGQNLIDIIWEGLSDIVVDMYKKDVVISIAELGNDAGIVGAAYYAINDWNWTI
ncbi:ROK family protein [Mesoplasma lactucae]|uniref:Sugar kinase n=1 Tax=Mesoplasma lactucae ATCC 49193 TaxID=81460 RepID=A0A291IR31_9MOLU|nr:ROK family protein [Mesoplasma lactucae]ATG97405.1 sugar kinase [Mesoplasma lactucae ATCC 49193]ATZ20142.1 glucokinase [Mesoplasma lactucae ATCC 49193]MCL8216890.1 Glucokinase [Mesoplasma lactucae ATCC 49193]